MLLYSAVSNNALSKAAAFVLYPTLLKLHISTQLIKSFPTTDCPWSCGKEKLPLPLHAHPLRLGEQFKVFVQICPFKSRIFVLCPFLLKLHILAELIESFPMIYSSWSSVDKKLQFTPVHTSYQTDHEGVFPPLWRVIEFQARYHWKAVQVFFWGKAKFGKCREWSLSYLRLYILAQTHTRVHTLQLI